jgi:hypothetical protein
LWAPVAGAQFKEKNKQQQSQALHDEKGPSGREIFARVLLSKYLSKRNKSLSYCLVSKNTPKTPNWPENFEADFRQITVFLPSNHGIPPKSFRQITVFLPSNHGIPDPTISVKSRYSLQDWKYRDLTEATSREIP